ncbi:hypothetical protein ACQR2L_13830 [Clostridium butyricum]|uniref:hypothetical protein n=1 Tax=Clostridium butyricum TaxID=1492 RepID=UPI003D13F560
MNIKFVSLDNIDFENNKVIPRNVTINDAKDYITSLINTILSTTKKREFESKKVSHTITNINSIVNLFITKEEVASTLSSSKENSNNFNKNDYNTYTNTIAQKLLQEQITATNKYKQLTRIQKGSLIQALVEYNNSIIYLSCLIEHSTFIDETDLKYKIGLPKSDKATLKSCMVHYSNKGDINTIYVSDSKPKIAEYWYDGFLELIPKRDNRTNTTQIYNSIRNTLNAKLSLSHKADCTNLNNALNVIFSKDGDSFNLSECLDFLFNNYTPISDKLIINDIRTIVETNIEKQKIDTVFDIDNCDIKSKLKNIKYTITDNIEVKFKTSKTNLNDYVYSTTMEGDEKVLIIKNISEDAYYKFLPSED